MSTILDALKRIDEQRRSEASPRTLEEQVLAAGARPRARNKWPFAVGGAAGALLLAAGGWVALREPAATGWVAFREPSATGAKAQAAMTATPPAALGTAAMGSRPAASALPVTAPADPGIGVSAPQAAKARPGSELATPPADSAETVDAAAAPASAAAPATLAAPLSPPATLGSAAAVPARATAARQHQRAPQVAAAPSAAKPESAAEPARAEAAPAEPAPEPLVAVAPTLPDVRVEQTQWHPTPAKRSARVRIGEDGELRELHEGDAVGGVVVKEIRPSSVVFLYDGSEFRRGVGGS